MNQDLPRVNKQDDIFTAYDRRNAPEQPVSVGQTERVELPGELEFPQYETPKVDVKKAKQDEIEPQKAHEAPGLETFNLSNLISHEMWDIAEYFLGRPLTGDEKLSGMVDKTEVETLRKRSRDKDVLESLARLVQMAQDSKQEKVNEKLLRLEEQIVRNAANHPLPDDDEDDEQIARNAANRPLPPDYEDEEEDDDQWGQFAQVPEGSPQPFSPLDQSRYLSPSPDDDVQSVTDTEVARTEVGAPGSTISAPTVLMGPQGKKPDPLAPTIVPDYNPDTSFTISVMKAMIYKMQNDTYKRFKDATDEEGKPPVLFTAIPKSGKSGISVKKDYEDFLKNANQDILRFTLLEEIEAESEPASSKPAKPASSKPAKQKRADNVPEEPESTPLPLKAKGLIRREYKKRELVPFGPKWLTDPLALKEGNELIILRQTDRGHMNKHPNRIVSAAMKVCLLEYLAGRPMPTELLTADEKEFLQWLMEDGRMAFKQKPPTPLRIVRTPKQMKDRLSILYGEIAEGPNDNPDVKREFKNLFNQVSLMGLLSKPQIENLHEFIKTF